MYSPEWLQKGCDTTSLHNVIATFLGHHKFTMPRNKLLRGIWYAHIYVVRLHDVTILVTVHHKRFLNLYKKVLSDLKQNFTEDAEYQL